jgi:hypothetical protein
MISLKNLVFILLLFTMLSACEEEEATRLAGPFILEKIEILRANSLDGRVLPYSSSDGPRLFLRFGPFQGAYPAYRSGRSRRVTELPVTWGFEQDSIPMEDQDWYVVLYELNRDLGEDLLFSQRLSLLDYQSPVKLTDSEGKFRIDLHYRPIQK